MINYETIISNFDDKVTLYNWLRKVEEALKNASATNFVVNKKGNATLSFSITFADGETLESGDIVLQQGESVDQARIASGILQLHLTNGTWLTAGNIKPVSNFEINASQHLIVNYQDGTSQDLGAIFNGNVNISGTITADNILENQAGYYFIDDGNMSMVYVGVAKTGNKITFVLFGTYEHTASASYKGVGNIAGIPASVGEKLYPYTQGDLQACLESRKITLSDASSRTIKKDVVLEIGKVNDNNIAFRFLELSELELGHTYLFRIEQTFLLSDNLLQ